ncbi:hypothetical protein SAY87_010908 [Trapa incisa]|uniref:RWP-RK domain-containing protein n=1 Tax=Trapa incisa TaxID=236973 RepID=A0AAN7GFB8_9MYRT|nr:hypothetical protein SAY87_010908 [Trapa incisa]
MGDPQRSVVPDHDPLDLSSFFDSDVHSFVDWTPLTAIHSTGRASEPDTSFDNHHGVQLQPGTQPIPAVHQNVVNPFSDQHSWSICFGDTPPRDGSGSGSAPAAGATAVPRVSNVGARQSVLAEPAMLPSWPPPATPFVCSCCQILREIIHVNESNHYTKLELHGRTGMIFHAIQEDRPVGQPNSYYHMFDFCNKSIEDVKKFLKQYCDEKTGAGYRLIKDPLHMFYEAVCVGLVWEDGVVVNTESLPQHYPMPEVAGQATGEPSEYATGGPSGHVTGGPSGNAPRPSEHATGGPSGNALRPSEHATGRPSGNATRRTGNRRTIRTDQPSGAVQIIDRPAGTNRNRSRGVQIVDRPASTNPNPSRGVQIIDQPAVTNPRPSLSEQRERTLRMTRMDFAQYFHLPLNNAAEIIGLSPTVIKRICRREGLNRWPYRKVKSRKRKIRMLRERLRSEVRIDRQATLAQIERLQREISDIRYGVPEPPDDDQ